MNYESTLGHNKIIEQGQILLFNPDPDLNGKEPNLFYVLEAGRLITSLQIGTLYVAYNTKRNSVNWWVIRFSSFNRYMWEESVGQSFGAMQTIKNYDPDHPFWENSVKFNWQFFPMKLLPEKTPLQLFFEFYETLKI